MYHMSGQRGRYNNIFGRHLQAGGGSKKTKSRAQNGARESKRKI